MPSASHAASPHPGGRDPRRPGGSGREGEPGPRRGTPHGHGRSRDGDPREPGSPGGGPRGRGRDGDPREPGSPGGTPRRGRAGDSRRTATGGRGPDTGSSRSASRREPDGRGEVRRPQAPSEKRRTGSSARTAKQSRRRGQLEAAREALRPGPGRMLIEGRRPVVEALRAGRPVDRVLLASGVGKAALGDLLDLAQRRGVEVATVPRSLIESEARSGAHQGVLAIVAPIEPIDLIELLAIPLAGREPPFFLALDGVEDPHNLGALARSAEAAGCHGLVVPRHRSAPLSAVAVKSSAGALEHLPVAEVPNLARAIEHLRDSGVWCIGLDGGAEASLFDLQLADEPVCVVVGGEGAGLHRLVRDSCDALVHIPMSGRIESLNASVAGALALFEVRRRRSLTSP
jgi:23S rRNA (guanosine2251-2'-O)-methyltransferase